PIRMRRLRLIRRDRNRAAVQASANASRTRCVRKTIMSSKITPDRHDDGPARGAWRPARELAPSFTREEHPRLPRIVGMWGLMATVLGAAILILTASGVRGLFGVGWGTLFLGIGLVCLLYSA